MCYVFHTEILHQLQGDKNLLRISYTNSSLTARRQNLLRISYRNSSLTAKRQKCSTYFIQKFFTKCKETKMFYEFHTEILHQLQEDKNLLRISYRNSSLTARRQKSSTNFIRKFFTNCKETKMLYVFQTEILH